MGMSYHCPMYEAVEDFEYRGEHYWIKVEKGEKRGWFDFAVIRFPELWKRLD